RPAGAGYPQGIAWERPKSRGGRVAVLTDEQIAQAQIEARDRLARLEDRIQAQIRASTTGDSAEDQINYDLGLLTAQAAGEATLDAAKWVWSHDQVKAFARAAFEAAVRKLAAQGSEGAKLAHEAQQIRDDPRAWLRQKLDEKGRADERKDGAHVTAPPD